MRKIKRGLNNKKAISPVVSTVLLIMIVIILAIIILLWSRGFIKEKLTKFEKPIENVCREVSIKPFLNDDFSFGFMNNGNVPIYQFDVKTSKEGSSNVHRIEKKVDVGISVDIENYNYNDYEEVIIIPVLLGKSSSQGVKEYTCPEQSGFVV
jgi:flagellin-like protein